MKVVFYFCLLRNKPGQLSLVHILHTVHLPKNRLQVVSSLSSTSCFDQIPTDYSGSLNIQHAGRHLHLDMRTLSYNSSLLPAVRARRAHKAVRLSEAQKSLVCESTGARKQQHHTHRVPTLLLSHMVICIKSSRVLSNEKTQTLTYSLEFFLWLLLSGTNSPPYACTKGNIHPQ